jgi:RNA ligase (TIGR02306 family)
MAFFGVTIEEIDKVEAIPGADRIEKATVKGMLFEFVIGKGSFKPNDRILYFPVDSLIPNDIAEKLGVAGKLAGPNKNRLKTIKLKQQISQGLVGPLDLIKNMPQRTDVDEPTAITEYLKIEKWESEPITCKNANLLSLPCGLSKYDIDGADRYPRILETLMDQEIVVSEKMEGSQISITRDVDGKIYVNQRRHTIEVKEGEEHTWWKVAKESKWIDFVEFLTSALGKDKAITIYGEMCGPSIQGNIYKFKEHRVFTFDIKVGDNFIDFTKFEELVKSWEEKNGLKDIMVPILFKGKLKDYLNGKKVSEVSNGKSVFGDFLREGIVIKPITEQSVYHFGRLVLKMRSPSYLAKSDN